MGRRFLEFVEGFTPHFRLGRRQLIAQAKAYLRGLMQAQRKNMERMVEVVPEADYQQLQHFISCSPWDARAVMDEVALRADAALGDEQEACFLIDESSFAKKGEESVGVARQWCGREGKVDNCQVAVFGCLSHGEHAALVDTRLYLPKEWIEDPERCRRAKVPDEQIVQRSKADLGLEMVRHAREIGLRFGWVGADAGYGKDPGFLRALDASGEQFIVDVHKDQRVYLDDPAPYLREPKTVGGRPPSRRVTEAKLQRVDAWAGRQPRSSWKKVRLRESTKGTLTIDVLHRYVWVWDGEEAKVHRWHLLVTREARSQATVKYALSNMPLSLPVPRLARMLRQRYWIERSFQDSKSECGMGEYQTRGWVAWHHQMALVMMALQFMLEERLQQKAEHPLLSCSDIETLLAHFLPRRDVTLEEVVRQMEVRHQQRQDAIEAAYAAQRSRKLLNDNNLNRGRPK